MNNIYINSSDQIFLGPIKINDFEENELWYSPPECKALDIIYGSTVSDIWSIGCIMAEIFFVETPLLYSFNYNDKIRKIVQVEIINIVDRITEIRRCALSSR
jgi:serine/threonine protein kinase